MIKKLKEILDKIAEWIDKLLDDEQYATKSNDEII